MLAFEWIIGLLLGAMVLSALARRLSVPYPTFLALGGMALAFIPGVPNWTLEPDLALALLVAPVLLDAAFDTSLRDLRANWLSVSTLVLVAVALTTAVVAAVAHWLVPGMPWAAAIALGAIVAPPDAGAATAILRSVRLPYRLLKILEGESLLNDASALLIYRVAVGAALATSLSFSSVAPVVAIALIGSPIAGFILAKVIAFVTRPIEDIPTMIIIQFVNCFLVWILAEKLGLSPIVTIVVFAITTAQSTPARTPARKRVPAYAVWETMVFLLNVVAFVAIGMQLRPIWSGLDVAVRWRYCAIAVAVLIVVILIRFAWVMSFNAVKRFIHRRRDIKTSDFSVKEGVLVSWCGMRGIVTLAAAFALPEGFPWRDLILLTAFGVVLGTLVLQGLTLRPLILRLALDDDDPLAREVELARAAVYRAALAVIEGDPSREAKILRLEYEQMLIVEQSERLVSGELPADPLRRRMIRAARMATSRMRSSGEIGDDAYHRLEEELDWAELNAGGR